MTEDLIAAIVLLFAAVVLPYVALSLEIIP